MIHQQAQRFATFYRRHTGSDWQQLFAGAAVFASALLFLIGAVLYGISFLSSGNRQAAEMAIEFASAKIITTVIFIFNRKSHTGFGGPLLILVYLIFGATVLLTTAVQPIAIASFLLSSILAGLLYGFWCALIPTSVSIVVLSCSLVYVLQEAVREKTPEHIPYGFNTLFALAIIFSACSALSGTLHLVFRQRYQKKRWEGTSTDDTETHAYYTYYLELDTRQHEVKRNGAIIELRRKEYEILECLVKNKGKITTREMLSSKLWAKPTRPDSLGVHVKHLRDKIDKPFATKLIETSRGKGYLLKDLPRKSNRRKRLNKR